MQTDTVEKLASVGALGLWAALHGWLGWLAGLQDTPKSATPDQLISRFHWSKVPKTSIVVGST